MSLDPKPVDLKELQKKQLSGKDLDNTAGSDDKKYKYPAHESHLVHVRLMKKTNNPVTKSYDKSERIEKLNPDQFERMERNNSFAEYDEVTIVHDPRPKAEPEEEQEEGDEKDPSTPNKPIRSTQDAQMRYKELFGEDAPADKTFTELKKLIEEKEQAA